jgi:hypothetical protein
LFSEFFRFGNESLRPVGQIADLSADFFSVGSQSHIHPRPGTLFEGYSKDSFPADVLSGQKIMNMAINFTPPKERRRFSPFTLTKKQHENGLMQTFLGECP